MRVPKSVLELNGFNPGDGGRRELVKLLVRWPLKESKSAECAFANYYPKDRRAEVYLGGLGNGENDRFKIMSAKRYDLVGFVDDFNGKKLLNLQNVKLGTDGGALWMDVDGRRVRLFELEMTTFGSLVNLTGSLSKMEPEIKFEYDGKSAIARFKGHPLIEYMQVHGDELEIRYAQSKNERHVCWVDLKNG